ncbi:restriction endonuclease subunit S [Helicobacter sp. faydin-H75]|uniref:Restriction endonuclease subunit S n=2 Tax=Helicobacter cappadocius TaxID=3063998 RepID=A0ABT8Z5T1_9HELI|nr:restriction endonuclease subunit S [Helicobacter sp. faydin-H75]
MLGGGVEYKSLREVCKTLPKGTLKKDEVNQTSQYPVINGGCELYGFYDKYNNEANAFTFSARGSAGFVSYFNTRFWAGGLCYPYTSKNENILITKFIYYYLKSQEQNIMDTLVARGSIPALNKSDIDNLKIPIPPLPIQEEIVKILDTFTELEGELEAELKLRQKQYKYYLNKLLSFENDGGGGLVQWLEMQEVFDIRNGYTPSKAKAEYWEGGNIPWFRMEDIRTNGRMLSDSIQHITKQAVKGKLFPANSIIVATTATIGEHALITVDCLANQQFTFLTKKQTVGNKLNMKFFYYYMFIVDEWCKEHVNSSSFASVDMAAFRKLKIPIPPLEEQERIVGILDKFDELVSDISLGIPAEIQMRKKQYEYYRDKLLRFEE